jgi:hypothetical protein
MGRPFPVLIKLTVMSGCLVIFFIRIPVSRRLLLMDKMSNLNRLAAFEARSLTILEKKRVVGRV